jgi:hypothetical protein
MAGYGQNDQPAQDGSAPDVAAPSGGYGTNDRPADAPKPGLGIGRRVKDLGLSLAQGVVSVPQTAVGLADLVTGGAAGKAVENAGVRFDDAQKILGDLQSDEFKAQQQGFHDADGVLPKIGYALTNPALIANSVVQSLPVMGAGGVLGRGALALAPRIGSAVAAGIGEGAAQAGQAAEQIRQEDPNGELSAKQAALAVGSGVIDAAIAGTSGRIANRLGIGDADQMLVRGTRELPTAPKLGAKPKGVARRVAEGMATEGLLEEVPQSINEQVLQNLAQDKPWSEGVADQAIMGGLSGAAMGGVAGGISRPHVAAPPPPPGPLSQAAALLPAPTVHVDSAGRAKMDGVPSAGFDNGQQQGVRTEAAQPAPAGLLPPPSDVQVDAQGNARAFGQIPPAPAPGAPGPIETGAMGAGRNSEPVPQRRLPGPQIEVDGQKVATTADDRNDTLQGNRAAAEADRARRTELGLPQVRDGDVLNEKGAPFHARFAAARAARQAGPGYQAVQVEGGFVARRATEQAQDVEVKHAAPTPQEPAAAPAARPAAPAPSAAPAAPAVTGRPAAVPVNGPAPAPVSAVPRAPVAPPVAPAPVTAPKTPESDAQPALPGANAAQTGAPGLRVGVTPNDTVPVTVRNGVVHLGNYPAVHYESGEDVHVPEGATTLQIKKALSDAGALGRRQKFFGSNDSPPSGVAPAPAPAQNVPGAAETPATTSINALASDAQTATNTPKGAEAPAPTSPAQQQQQPQTPPAGEAPAPVVKVIGKSPNMAVLIDGIPHKSGFENEVQARQAAATEIARRAAAKDQAPAAEVTNPPAPAPYSPQDKPAPSEPAAAESGEKPKKSAKEYTGRTWVDQSGKRKKVLAYQGGDTVTVATIGKEGTRQLTVDQLEAEIARDTAAPAPAAAAAAPIDTDLDGTKVRAAVEYAAGREVAHGIRKGNPMAIAAAARALAPLVGPGDTLVPMPGARGLATYTAKLADAIAAISGSTVDQALNGVKRESLYELKKSGGDPASVDLGLEFSADMLKPGTRVVIVDNVLATGTTARAAIAAAKAEGVAPTVLVYAIDRASAAPSVPGPAPAPAPQPGPATPEGRIDGWRDNLVKARVVAKQELDAGRIDKADAMANWAKRDALVALVDAADAKANGTQAAPAPAPAPAAPAAPAAPVRASRETIDLRKRVSAMESLIKCLKGAR